MHAKLFYVELFYHRSHKYFAGLSVCLGRTLSKHPNVHIIHIQTDRIWPSNSLNIKITSKLVKKTFLCCEQQS